MPAWKQPHSLSLSMDNLLAGLQHKEEFDRDARCPHIFFVLAINELSMCLQEAMTQNHLSGIQLGSGCPPIHSLMFADDLIICGKADMQEVQHISQILQTFCCLSGQTPNWSKSSILFSKHVPPNTTHQIKSFFPVQDLQANTIHLGHPIILTHSDRLQAYNFVSTKFISKLTTVKANKLNHAGRLTYIQSVFAPFPYTTWPMSSSPKNSSPK